VWQGCSDYWQPAFIREHLLPLGHAAWEGYMLQGRGVLACEVAIENTKMLDWQEDVVEYTTRFVAVSDLPAYFQARTPTAEFIDRLLETVQIYHPESEMLIAIWGNDQVDINWLRSLAIAPPECYRQIRNRWPEFDLEAKLDRRFEDGF
jgi:hypothetical protein